MARKSSRHRILIPVALVVLTGLIVVAGGLIKSAVEKRKQKQTAIQMIDLSRLLRDYTKEFRRFPVLEEADLARFEEVARMAELQGVSLEDAWGRPFRFVSTKRHFLLWSHGRNGEVDRFPGGGRRNGPDVDLVIYDGKFWQLAHGI